MAMFEKYIGKFNHSLFSVVVENPTHHVNISTAIETAPFFKDSFTVGKRVSGPLRRDLTDRDELVLAILSLVLLLIIEGTLSTLLLRTLDGKVSTFGFSVKHVIEVLRDFNLPRSLKKQTKKDQPPSTIDKKQLAFAFSILAFMFGLEVGIIFLTSPELAAVNNSMVTFRIRQPVIPNWNQVNFHARTSVHRPCSSLTLIGVAQGATRINLCVTSDAQRSMEFLSLSDTTPVHSEIISDIHDYGAEHKVTIGDLSVTYSARAYFTLHDKKARLMKSVPQSGFEKEQIQVVHQQFIAHIFNSLLAAKKFKEEAVDEEMGKINSITYDLTSMEGPDVIVLQTGSIIQRSKSRRYVSNVDGVLPRGTPVLRIGQQIFRGSTAISIAEPEEEELFLEEGKLSRQTIIWQEKVRKLNWLSMLIICISALVVQALLRFKLKPVTTAYIAGLWVKNRVGADMERSPVQLDDMEKKSFQFYPSKAENEYRYGAETDNEESPMLQEY